jgi:hypothetical protein
MFAASKSGSAVGGGPGPGPGPTPTDPSFAYVPLLLNTTSTDGQQNNTFLDSGTANGGVGFTITRNGTPTQGSITPYWPNGQWSNYFNGSSDYLTLPASAALTLTANFTIEFWVYSGAFASGASNPSLFNTSPASIFYESSGSNRGLCLFVGSAIITTATTVLPNNQWNHVVCVRSGSTVSMFVNGSRVGTNASFGSTADFSSAFVGRYFGSAAGYLNGYMSNLRVVKGAAVYDPTLTTLTVPTAPLGKTTGGTNPPTGTQTSLLTCQSNRFIDNSDNPLAITVNGTPRVQAFQPFSPTASYTTALYGGSGYFNGSSSYLSIASPTATNIPASTDFTIEGWVYSISKINTAPTIFNNYTNFALPGVLALFVGHNSFAPTAYNINLNGTIVNGGTVVYNAWTHFAIVRNGTGSSNVALYINGVSVATSTSNAALSFNGGLYIGASGDGVAASSINGYISNFRWNNSTAVYTGNFTPPTLAPLKTAGSTSAASYTDTTNVNTSFAASNTSLLLNFTNAGIYDAAAQNNFTSFQNAVVSLTPTPTVGTTSLKVLTVGDYLTTPANPAFLLGTGDFTIEAWIYPTSTTNFISVMGIGTNGTTGDLQWFYNFNGNTNKVTLNGTGGTSVTSTASVPTGQWTYVAFSRASGSLKLFIGGALDKTASFADNLTKNTLVVGRSYASLNQEYFLGYIQDLRITKGVGRYNALSSIPVPTASFPTR